MFKNKDRFFYLIIILCFSLNFITIAQLSNTNSDYIYISPVPNSTFVSPYNNIIITPKSSFNRAQLFDKNWVEVYGSKSGIHSGEIMLSDNGENIIFQPFNSFSLGEMVTVTLLKGLRLENGDVLGRLQYNFEISNDFKNNILHKLKDIGDSSLPIDFPKIRIGISNNPSNGFLFLSPAKGNTLSYLMILNNRGIPIFYRKKPDVALVYFKPQANGLLTYYDTEKNFFYALDSSYAVVDSFMAGNGYPTDFHELLITQDNHAYLIIYDVQKVRMDTIVTGGLDTANVVGCIIQEIDSNKNVVWQWRSWDHFNITDANDFVDLTDSNIVYCHTNSIEIDQDGNIVISSKRMDEITKIDKATGNIIWRLGGKKNQFTFTNDNFEILQQHDARILANGNLLLFDNGLFTNRIFSRAVEYELNTTDVLNLNANKIWEFRNTPDEFSRVMGSIQRLPDGNTLIGWGSSSKTPYTDDDWRTITEVTPGGIKTFEMFIEDQNYSYQVFRYPWKTNLFTSDKDTLDFGFVSHGDSLIKSFNITNNKSEALIITSYYFTDSTFTPTTILPITIQPNNTQLFSVQYKPIDANEHIDTLLIRTETGTEMVAQYVILKADSNFATSINNSKIVPEDFVLFQNYPNPFNPSTTIKYSLPERSNISISIYNVLGELIIKLKDNIEEKGIHKVNWQPENISSGIYFYKAEINLLSSKKRIILTKKMLFIK